LNEVKSLGRFDSTARTADQQATALFWNLNTIVQYNKALRDVATQHHMDLVDTVRLLAMGEMSITDAAIACFDSKYHYLFWRPTTAIRAAATDGNPATEPDAGWATSVAMPNHPEYPSAHGCVTSAFANTVAMVLHTKKIDVDILGAVDVAGTVTTTRHLNTVQEMTNQIIDARVWIGFHYRFSVVAGVDLGHDVAKWALKHYFRPAGGGDDSNDDENDD
jgi:hypothetical protein